MRSTAGAVKIGFSARPEWRRKMVEAKLGEPVALVYAAPLSRHMVAIERAAHELLKSKGRNGEWFDVSVGEAIAAIDAAAAEVEAAHPADSLDEAVDRGNSAYLNMRIDADLKRRATNAAKADHRTLTSLIEKLLDEYATGAEAIESRQREGRCPAKRPPKPAAFLNPWGRTLKPPTRPRPPSQRPAATSWSKRWCASSKID